MLSEETKLKISKSMIKYLENNPEKVPYKLNHHSKGMSYPEKYFKEIFEKENLNFISEYPVSIYSLDFAFINNQIDIEIDGEQHYTDVKIIKSNKKRDDYLKRNNWTVVRIRWSDYKKLDKIKRENFIKNLIYFIKDKKSIPIEHRYKSKKEIYKEKRSDYNKGRILSNTEISRRYKLIEPFLANKTYGWISRCIKETGLTKNQIMNICKDFNIHFHYLKKEKSKFHKNNKKFTYEQIEWIRTHYMPRDKEFGSRALGKRFNVDHSIISDIIRMKTYKMKHV